MDAREQSVYTPFGGVVLGAKKATSWRLMDRLRRIFQPKQSLQVELIATLNEVAGAVSSAMSVRDVLEVIVDRVKLITDTDKAILILVDEHSEELDLDTMLVRGPRVRHVQDWWESLLPEMARSAFQSGEPYVQPYPDQGAVLLSSPVLVKDRPVGLLCVINSYDRPFSDDQINFLAIVSAFAASAIENARLAEQSRYVLLASERDRIAREMHDGVVQSLFSISLGMEVCKRQMTNDPHAALERLDDLQERMNTSMTELRRFIYDLRPMKLTQLGLVGAVEYWVREVTMGMSVRGKVSVEGDEPRISPSEEACLYRVTKEAVSNVMKHSGAESFEVRIKFEARSVHIEIVDDGCGFSEDDVRFNGGEKIGLRSIRQRIAAEGGQLELVSRQGDGTTVCIDLPLGA